MDASRPLCVSDNPPRLVARYPGKWGRNNLKGLAITKEEYLDQKTDDWLAHITAANPSYKVTKMSNKVRNLHHYLKAVINNRNASLQCRHLIERAEARASAADKENNDPGAEARASDADKENNEVGAEFTPKRVRRDFQLQRLLAMPNKEMFADPNIESFMQSRTVRERLEKYGQEVCSQMSSEELLSSGDSLRHVKETKAYKEWTQKVPALTRSCLTFLKENQSGVNKEDRSELFVMDSLAETLRALRMNPTKEGREQELVIAASLCSTEHGVPKLGMHNRCKKEASQMKARLLSGEDKVLKRAEWSPRQHFPQEVAIVAKNHWNEITITEPGKHRYVSKAMADKDETVPTRFVFVLIFVSL